MLKIASIFEFLQSASSSLNTVGALVVFADGPEEPPPMLFVEVLRP